MGWTPGLRKPFCITPIARAWRATAPGQLAAPQVVVLKCRRSRAARAPSASARIATSVERASAGERLSEAEISYLFGARDADFDHVCTAADQLRATTVGDTVRYVVNRNINYTNMCTYRCSFCAFSKGKGRNSLRGDPYLLDMEEISRRTAEAWDRGATEVCLQGGIHPSFTGETYLEICKTIKSTIPNMHVHAFSPLEVSHGAKTLGLSLSQYLEKLKNSWAGHATGNSS